MRNDQLHAAVLAAPDDDAPRLVYADWLLERGDPRGEMMAIQLAHARRPAGDAHAEELAARWQSLWQQHGEAWRAPYGTLEITYRHGFVEALRGTTDEFAEFGATAVIDACVRTLNLNVRGRTNSDVMSLLLPFLPQIRLRDLAMWHAKVPRGVLGALLCDPGARDLESLFAHGSRFDDGPVAMIANAQLTRLRELSLISCVLTSADVTEFTNWPAPLHTLRLSHNQLGPVAAVLGAPALQQLSALDLTGTGITEPDVVALAEAALPLVTLELSSNALGAAAIARLANSPCFARLERLGLHNTEMGSAGLEALMASPYLSRTLELGLDGEILGLAPDIWYDWTGLAIGASWRGEPPAHVKQRFRLVVEGSPAY